ncbi:MAG: phosphatase PAP2 family protein [Candidatus Marinimicrobia bacterium]|nr:phosphatase PAP2 family protein [Candidatus Neomarinimicrobiota bacterium]
MNPLFAWLDQIDRSILYFINDTLSNQIFDLFFTTITNEHLWAIPVLIGLLALIVRGGKRGKIAAVLVLIAASATDATVVEIIKPAIGRLRPSHALEDTINLLVPKGGRYGFVSAHAANIFAGTTVLSYFYKQWKKPLLFLAFSVALSRVYVGVHYPGDVLFGGLFGYGMAWLVITLWVLLKMRELKRGRTWVRYS